MSIIQSIFNTIGGVAGLFFEEPEVARYIVLAETLSGITVPHPEGANSVDFRNINAPGLISGSFPVLFFTTRHEGRAEFSVRLNNTTLIRRYPLENGVRTWHKFIPPGALKTQYNELVLSLQSGSKGKVIFADMFILYKSNELTVTKPLEPSQR